MTQNLRRTSLLLLLMLAMTVTLVGIDTSPNVAYALTFTVNNTSDAVDVNPGDGICAIAPYVPANPQCTLRAAIMEANASVGDDIITLDATTYQFTIGNTSGDEDAATEGDLDVLSAGGAITIIGQGPASTFIDASDLDRVFEVSGGTLELRNLTVQGGQVATTGGAGIYNDVGQVTLRNTVLIDNETTGGANGAAIYNRFGEINVLDGSVIGTQANPNIAAGNGGGIFTEYSGVSGNNVVTIDRSTVAYNQAGGDGGGIYAQDDGDIIISNGSNINNNVAGDEGGGIFVINTTAVTDTAFSLTGSTVDANQALNGAGGVQLVDIEGALIETSTISNNDVSNSGVGGVGVETRLNNTNLSFDINNTLLDTNTATTGNGTGGFSTSVSGANSALTVNFDSVVLDSNSGTDYGGAFISSGTTANITTSTFDGNQATGANSAGGGLANEGDTTLLFTSINDNSALLYGGGIDNAGTLTIERSTISRNRNEGVGAAGGAGIVNRGVDTLLQMTNSTISSNVTDGDGGGLHNRESAVALLDFVTVAANTADRGGGIFNDNSAGINSVTTLDTTLLGDNGATSNGPDCFTLTGGSGGLNSAGYAFIEDISSCTVSFQAGGDVTGQDPSLAPLGDYGGPTETHRLNNDSPAIDVAICPEQDDQRGAGFNRPIDIPDVQGPSPTAYCDIGAYEVQSFDQARLGNFVFNDLDADGIQDFGEPGVSGITVNLLDSSGTITLATTTTDANGIYLLNAPLGGQPAQTFIIEFVEPLGTFFSQQSAPGSTPDNDSDADPATGRTPPILVSGGDTRLDFDAGLYMPSDVSGLAFIDENGNGIQDPTELLRQSGIIVRLIDVNGVQPPQSMTTATDTDPDLNEGEYLFEDVPPGEYYVEFQIPAPLLPLEFTFPNQGADDAIDSDPDTITGQSEIFILEAGIPQDIWDVGLYEEGTISGFMWDDINGDGLYQIGSESAIVGSNVVVINTRTGNPIISGPTDSNGEYAFTVPPGSYIVEFTDLPPGYDAYTVQDVNSDGNDNLDSDVDRTTGQTPQLDLPTAGSLENVAAGIFQSVSIEGYIWQDDLADGLDNGGEARFLAPTVTIQVLTEAGNPVAGQPAVNPDPTDGTYSFTGLVPGNYIIFVTLPANLAFSEKDVGGNDAIDSDFYQDTGETDVISLPSGAPPFTNVNAGVHSAVILSGTVWDDDAVFAPNGVQENLNLPGGEPGVSGVTVNLYSSDGASLIASTTTDGNGDYSFDSAPAGDVVIEVIAPPNQAFTTQGVGAPATNSDVNRYTGRVATTLSQVTPNDIDAGLIAGVQVGDRVLLDSNADGNLAGEQGLPNITVRLLNSSGDLRASTVTSPTGNYVFTVDQGLSYIIEFVAPAGYVFSPQDAIPSEASDSDPDPLTGRVPFDADASSNQIDAGLYQLSSVSGTIFEDDGNGVRDIGEPLTSNNVTVNLLDNTGTQLDTLTRSDGTYDFADLEAGTYFIEVEIPAGRAFTIPNANGDSDDDRDSDVNQYTGRVSFTVASGDSPVLDAGLLTSGLLIDGQVWSDDNGDGINGVSEDGIPNVTVYLYDSLGGIDLIADTTTDANGNYQFAVPPNRTYIVAVEMPLGYTDVEPGQGGDPTTDSDITRQDACPFNPPVSVGCALIEDMTADETIDAGFEPLAAIGDFVWEDTNANGAQDGGELGIPNVIVNLLDSSGNPLVPPMSTTTDVDGNYVFLDLLAGDYIVEFILPSGYTFTEQSSPSGTNATDSDPDVSTGRTNPFTLGGGEQNLDIDAGMYRGTSVGDLIFNDLNGDGIQDLGETGVGGITVNLLDDTGSPLSPPVSTVTGSDGIYTFSDLPPGIYIVEVDLGSVPVGTDVSPQGAGADPALDSDIDIATGRTDPITLGGGEQNLDIDAGLILPARIEGFYFDDSANANGIQDVGETGLTGGTVALFDATTDLQVGATVNVSSTSDPNFNFDDLDAGSYYIQVTLPAGSYSFSPQDATTDDLDSDVNPTTFTSATFDVQSGQLVDNIDVGAYASTPVNGIVWIDTDENGLINGGETGYNGVTVNLYNNQGTQLLATTTTSGGGLFTFNVIDGNYQVEVVSPSPSIGFTQQDANGGASDSVDSDVDVITGRVAISVPTGGGPDINNLGAGLIQTQDNVPLEMSKAYYTTDPLPLGAGDTLTWVVCARNLNLEAIDGVVLTDSIDLTTQSINAGRVFYGTGPACPSGIPTGGDFTSGPFTVPPGNIVNGTVTTPTLNNVQANQVVILTIEITIIEPGSASLPAPESGVLAMSTFLLALGWAGLRLKKHWRLVAALVLIAAFFFTIPAFDQLYAEDVPENPAPALQQSENDGRWVRYDSSDPAIQLLGDWTTVPAADAIGGSYLRSEDPNAALTLTVAGQSARVRYVEQWNTAEASVFAGTSQIGVISSFDPIGDLSFVLSDVMRFPATDSYVLRVQSNGTPANEEAVIPVLTVDTIDVWVPDEGELETTSVTGVVWSDSNSNELLDDTDRLLEGVTVELFIDFGTNDTLIDTQVTDSNGRYVFTNLPDDQYWIVVDRESLPDNIDPTSVDWSPRIVQTPHEGDIIIPNALQVPTGSPLNGRVLLDLDNDQSASEADSALAGVTVNLYIDDGDLSFNPTSDGDFVVASQVSGDDGNLSFDGLLPGVYWVDVDTDNLPELAQQDQIWSMLWLRIPEIERVDIVLLPEPARFDMAGGVFLDNNFNAVVDEADSTLEGVTLRAYADDGDGYFSSNLDSLVGEMVSAEDGSYNFASLEGGVYWLIPDMLSLPATALQNQVWPPLWVRIPNIQETNVLLLPAPTTEDFTFDGNGTLSGTVFNDDNGNRLHDTSTESGIREVLVYLYNDDGDGNFNANDALINSVEVDATGRYSFEDLPNGMYWVAVEEGTLPANYMDTVAYGGHGDQNPQSVEITGAISNSDLAFNVEGPDFAYALDTDSDGSPDGREGSGDRDNDNIPNYLDGFDPTGIIYGVDPLGNTVPLADVEVSLVYVEGGETLLADTIQPNPQRTDARGGYRFDINALPGGLPPDGSDRTFRILVDGVDSEAFTFPSTTYEPGGTLVINDNNAQVSAFNEPNPGDDYFMAFRAAAADADLVNNNLTADALQLINTDIENTACGNYPGSTQACADASVNYELTVNFTVTPGSTSVDAEPGTTQTFTHVLSNVGTNDDSYLIELFATESWTQSLEIQNELGQELDTINPNGSYETPELAMGESVTLILTVTVPTEGVSNGDFNNSTISITSTDSIALGTPVVDQPVDTVNIAAGCIVGTVFIDQDLDGRADINEGYEGALLTIFNTDGDVVVRDVETDPDGRYEVAVAVEGSSETYNVQLDEGSLPNGRITYLDPSSPEQDVTVSTDDDCSRANFAISVLNPTLTKNVTGTTALNPGDTAFFEVILSNPSNSSTLRNATLTDFVPTSGFSSVTSSYTLNGPGSVINQGTSGNTVGLRIESLEPGSSVIFQIQAIVRSDLTNLPLNVSNVANLNFDDGSSSISSNTVTVTISSETGEDGTGGEDTGTDGTSGSGTGSDTGTDSTGGTGGADTATGTGEAGADTLPQTGYMPIEYILAQQDAGSNSNADHQTAKLSTAGRIVLVVAGLLAIGLGFLLFRFYNNSESLYEWLQEQPQWMGMVIMAVIILIFLFGGASVLYTANDIAGVVDVDQLTGLNDDADTDAERNAQNTQDDDSEADGNADGDRLPTFNDNVNGQSANGVTWMGGDGSDAFAQQLPGLGYDEQQFIIPSLNVFTRIVNAPRVGTSWDVSDFFNEVAFLEGTSAPGVSGNTVIAGHITHTRGLGPFRELDNINQGDVIIVRDYDIEYTYYVTDIMDVSPKDIWVTDDSSDALLTLVTCSGWDPNTRTYDSRIVVRARLDKWRILSAEDGAYDEQFGERTRYEIGETEAIELTESWESFTSYNVSDGTYHYSESKDAVATLTFTGDKFRVSYVMFSNFGEFEIYLDGELLMTVDAYSPYSGFGATNVIQSTPGTHTLEIRNTDRANADSKGNVIALDAIDVWR